MPDYGDFEARVLPNGMTVFHRDSDHAYFTEIHEKAGKWSGVQAARMVSVTTILRTLAKDALLDWAANLAREGVDWRETRNQAGQRGTSAHDIVVRTILGDRTSLKNMEEEHRPYGQAGFRWLSRTRPTIELAEKVVCSREHRYAGRFDFYTKDGVLADLKTVSRWAYRDGKRLPPYPENCLQLDLYALAMVESGYPEPKHGLVVRLGPDGTFDEYPVDLDPARGLAVLGAYRARAEAVKALKAGIEDLAVAA